MKKNLSGWVQGMTAFLAVTILAVPSVSSEEAAEKDRKDTGITVLEDLVVTANRNPSKKEEIPSVVEVISSKDIETTVDDNITRILKKNSSVDVIDYPGVSSGISIRGFRPEYSGIIKHSLILVDGRPAGAENIATILKNNVERIEVLKGPASALYGAEAMGGVVNIITKKSTGDIHTSITTGGGSFETLYGSISSGGAVNESTDYDVSFGNKVQNEDFTMGNGKKRDNTSYKEMNAAMRLGHSINDVLRMNIRGDWYGGRDIMSPNALHYGDMRPSEKNIDRYGTDLTIQGMWANDKAALTLYAADEQYDLTQRYTDQTPYKSYDTETKWVGMQMSDTHTIGDHDITAGFDYQDIDKTSQSFKNDGTRKAPSSPDNGRETFGAYSDFFLRFFSERLIFNGGLRFDSINIETEKTPYKTDFTPGRENFGIVNPRAGIKYFFDMEKMFQFHSTIGTAFVPPDALQIAGYAETVLTDGTIMYLRGNPDLDPEKSLTWDGGLGLTHSKTGFSADLTYFHTDVTDKITDKNVSATERTYVNAFDAEMSGLEWELGEDFGKALGLNRKIELYINGTHFFKAEEELGDNKWSDIHNVSGTKFNTGISYDDNTVFGRFNARYMGKRKDKDWYTAGYPVIEYDDFTVYDLSAGINFLKSHKIKISVDNIFDKNYFEKPEYPMPGRAIYGEYSIAL